MEPCEDDGALQLQDAGGGGGNGNVRFTQEGSNGECRVGFPGGWLGRLSRELHWSFLLAVVAVYGACQGVGDALSGVATGYYWKDVQRVQPSAAQFYQGVTGAPWVIKPLWGLLTDVVPVAGYRRRPYLVLAGVVGVTSTLMLSLHRELGIMAALLALTALSTGAAIASVTVDALVAQKCITHPPLASDMQSMCGFSSSVGALLGFSLSGLLVHSMGSQSALGLLAIPSALAFSAGILLKESPDYFFAVIDNSISQMVGQIKWLPLLVLSSKLCPSGIEGTFYALLMSIQNAGVLMSAWWGGLLLHMLNVTRTEFSNLWMAVLIRNISRLVPLMLLFLVPQSDHDSLLLPPEMLQGDESAEAVKAEPASTGFSVLIADDYNCFSSNVDVENEGIKVFDAGNDDVELIPLVNKSGPIIAS